MKKIELLEELRKWYNGYRFSQNSMTKVYNPFSLLLFLSNHGSFENYWFGTGNPSFLYRFLKQNDFYIEELEGVSLKLESLKKMKPEHLMIEPLLFQTGYLTISDYHQNKNLVTLDFPNLEVRQSFISHYLEWLSGKDQNIFSRIIDLAKEALIDHNVDGFMNEMRNYFIQIPYLLHSKNSEKHYHSLFYVFVASLGFGIQAEAEVVTSRGRMDLCIETKTNIYICELKVDKTPKEALMQIHQRRYYDKFTHQKKRITLIGISFDSKTNTISDWKKEELENF